MSTDNEATPGAIIWTDLTVADAKTVRDFYSQVTGWQPLPVDMGDYSDFNMTDAEGNSAAGICHARGGNANLPPQWLIYITVPDVDASAARCKELGGKVVDGPRDMGGSRFCVIQDPAGAVAGLISRQG